MQIIPYGNNGFELISETDYEKAALEILSGKVYEAVHNPASGNLNFKWNKKDKE